MCKHRVDQHLIVLNFYSISINKILITELMTNVSQNRNSLQKKKISTVESNLVGKYFQK